ncbi:hypothetical protein [Stutzerimonas stutzeri]|uniref:hypothetical protein n=1 Tax=Stutzerimonas stutzeri TaxID=316 RepID=UPI001BD54393|nr:hypothetical protein [Stutzerimonas stutzeri]MBS9723813.1 hypothetical protein [Stutzerimonas stutzeri]
MAVRKKSETIHLRVRPFSKALLEGLANSTGKTSTQLIEELITEAASKFSIEAIPELINIAVLRDGQLDLKTVVESAHVEHDAILTKLRTFYIAQSSLSLRDRIIASTIIDSPELFSGNSEIFAVEDEIVKPEFISSTPKLDLHEITRRMPSLEDFAAFREKNPGWKSTYKDFLKMIGED